MKLPRSIYILSARYVSPFKLSITFSDYTRRIIDFVEAFQGLKDKREQFNNTEAFKQFTVKGGRLYWGANEDVTFPIQQLYRGNIF